MRLNTAVKQRPRTARRNVIWRKHRKSALEHIIPAAVVPREDIKSRRKKQKLSQARLASEVGSHPQTVDKIERGLIRFSRFLPLIEQRLGIVPTQPTQQGYVDGFAGPQARGSPWVKTALDIAAIRYSLARSPDSKRKAMLIEWTLKDGSSVSGALDVRMIQDAAREFRTVAAAAGIDLTKLFATKSQ